MRQSRAHSKPRKAKGTVSNFWRDQRSRDLTAVIAKQLMEMSEHQLRRTVLEGAVLVKPEAIVSGNIQHEDVLIELTMLSNASIHELEKQHDMVFAMPFDHAVHLLAPPGHSSIDDHPLDSPFLLKFLTQPRDSLLKHLIEFSHLSNPVGFVLSELSKSCQAGGIKRREL